MKKSRMTKEEKMFHSVVVANMKAGIKPTGAVLAKWLDLQLNSTY